MEEQHTYELIEDYLHDRMTEKERLLFEEKIAKDNTLAAEVKQARSANEAIHFACLAGLKETVGRDIKNIKYNPPSRFGKVPYLILAVALTSATAVYLLNNNTPSLTEKHKSTGIQTPLPEKTKEKTPEKNSEPEKTKDDITGLQKSDVIQENKDTTGPSQEIHNGGQPENIHKALPDNRNTSTPDTNHTPSRVVPPADKRTECLKTFEIKTEPACKNQENGSVVIETDGSRGYDFQVDAFTSSGIKGIFHNLSAGSHFITITYDKECTFSKQVLITEKWCPLNSAFSFNPDYQEKWEIRYEPGTEGMYFIYDRSGKEIYKNRFGAGGEYWNGTDMHGGTVPMGVYIAVIQYSDGRKEKVEITIIR